VAVALAVLVQWVIVEETLSFHLLLLQAAVELLILKLVKPLQHR
jgi:hypothetical protein